MTDRAKDQAAAEYALLKEMVAALECKDNETAIQNILKDPLLMEVRAFWHSPKESSNPDEFRILLCTGGPAIGIRGKLDQYMNPCEAWMAYRDWGASWIRFPEADQSILLAYCSQFCFGE